MVTTAIGIIPQPKTYGPLGNLPQLDLHQPSQSIMKLSYEYGPIFKLKFPTGTGIFISSAELVEDAADESRFDKLVNAPLQKVRAFSGDGLFTSWTKEENWRKAHNILLPSFSQSAMKGYHSMMVDIALQLVQKWSRLNSDDRINVPEDMTRLTLDTIGLCGFNYRFNSFYREKPHRFIKSMGRALDEAMNQSNRLGVQDKLMIKKKRQFNRDIEYMFSLVDRIIEERKKSDSHEAEDLLSRMLICADPVTGEKLSDENIRYQIITFLIAGHETTSGLLSFALYYLMKHPEVLAKAYEEVDQVLTSPIPTYQQVRQLKYIRMILNESLRLWPTAPLFSLYAKEDTLLAGKYPLKRRDVVNILLPVLHRDPHAWGTDAEEFKPERFADPKNIPHHAFKPFGNGQRACIGQQFAMHEATLLIGMILKQFEFIDYTNYQLKIKETLTFKPDNLYIKVLPRISESSVTFIHEKPMPLNHGNRVQTEKTNWNSHNTPLLVLYGSNMGTAEGIAHDLAVSARFKGFQSEFAPLDDFIGKLPTQGVVLIVTSSYNGNPPKNARKFVKWLKEADRSAATGVRYAVFGCGDTNWASTYQSIPTLIDEQLAEKGASRLVIKGQGDASADFEQQFEAWHEQLWPEVFKAMGLKHKENTLKDSLAIQFVSGPNQGTPDHPASINNVLSAHVPQNSSVLIERVLNRFALERFEQFLLSGDKEKLVHLPLEFPVRAWDLLKYSVNLEEQVTQLQLSELIQYTVCPPHKRELTDLANNKEMITQNDLSMLDLLEKYPACELPFERFIELLSPLKAE
ncbi:cytochrome P450 [Neobacillus cucumis]|uniref:NADPH--cytochrome reductase n=1 Tax=Neobacillus cucumis TaxID=1740721 RepID=A0A2N5HPB1_9BACI|nr:NADPH--cytochrome reductase [Neobacillus cucumis]